MSKKKKKKVILSALQSGKAGVFSDQPLTRLMVIFLHRRRFTVKGSRLPAAFLSLFTLPSFCFSSSPLLVNGVPADASLCFVFFTLLISPPTKCSCFKYIHQLLQFGAGVSNTRPRGAELVRHRPFPPNKDLPLGHFSFFLLVGPLITGQATTSQSFLCYVAHLFTYNFSSTIY